VGLKQNRKENETCYEEYENNRELRRWWKQW